MFSVLLTLLRSGSGGFQDKETQKKNSEDFPNESIEKRILISFEDCEKHEY